MKSLAAFLFAVAIFTIVSISYQSPGYQYMQRTTVMLEIRAEDGKVVGHGSGVLIGGNRVLTAGHVAQYLEEDIDVFIRFRQGEEVPAELVKIEHEYADEWLTDDIALLRIDNNYNYPTASISCEVQPVGTDVFMVGHPMDTRWSVTQGYVMSTYPRKGYEKGAWTQIDGTAWTGNSGGPIFDRYGDIVGVMSHVATSFGGAVGFSYGVSGPSICEFLKDN